jgi:hypothetical protein
MVNLSSSSPTDVTGLCGQNEKWVKKTEEKRFWLLLRLLRLKTPPGAVLAAQVVTRRSEIVVSQ